jgi:hypothetical protein
MRTKRQGRGRWINRVIEGWRELTRTPVRFAFHLAVARLVTQWRSLLTIIAGTVLSACIGALVPLYTTAVAQVGLTQHLADEPANDVHASASINLRASTTWSDGGTLVSKAVAFTDLVRERAKEDLGVIDGWVDEVVFFIESEATGIAQIDDTGAASPLIGMRTRLGFYEGWEHQVRVVEGRLPQESPAGSDEMELVIGLNVANEVKLKVGTVVQLDQGMDRTGKTGGGHPSSRLIRARIVGIVAPLDEESPYWMEPSPLRLLDRKSGSGLWDYEFVLLTTEQNVYCAAVDDLPDTPNRLGWRILFAHDNLPFARIDDARRALTVFDRNLTAIFSPVPTPGDTQTAKRQDAGYIYHTRLIDYDLIRKDLDRGLLLEYAKEQELLDAPFGLLLLQVGALVLFFLMVTAALVRRGERREIAMLQSRGAWDSQIVLLRGIEALLICALAVVVAPFVAQRLLIALGPTVANTEEFPLPLTADVFVYAAIAATVTFMALIFTLRAVLRLPLILAGGAASRSEKQHWWQRYYLDAVLALVGLGALALLVRQGSPLSDVNLGGKQADPLMLMAPALLFLALGSLALRFFPILAQIAARASSAGKGLLSALASWQLSREPVHYGRITFLLALAVGIGWFATSFRATVTNSQQDQARYAVGTDVRFVERDTQLNANRARLPEDYQAMPEVEAASTAFRLFNINLSTSLTGDLRGTLLGIDPDTFGQTLYWRDDLGPVYSTRAPGDPLQLPERGVELPNVPAKIGVWAQFQITRFGRIQGLIPSVDRLVQRTDLNLRFLDANGAWVIVPVRPVETEYIRVGEDEPGFNAASFVTSGWVYCEADLSALDYTAQGPLRFVSVYWQYRSQDTNGERGMRLLLADMTLIDAAGHAEPYAIFGDQPWQFMYDSGALATGETTAGWQVAGSRGDSVVVRWDQDAQRSTVGVLLNYPETGPVDAIISRRMQQENGLASGADAAPFTLINIAGQNLAFRAVQVADYYPSVFDIAPNDRDAKGNSFMVVDERTLLYLLNRRPSATFYPDEVWLRLNQDRIKVTDEDAVNAFVRGLDRTENGSVVILNEKTLAGELDKLRTDPLGLGLLGLMYLAFVMALALSVVGLLTYSGLTAQARRTEFGVLRALGLSSLRVVAGLALEQAFVMGVGVTLGGLLGGVLAAQVVPTLAIGATGEGVIPPFVMRVEISRLIEYALLMVVVLGLVLSSSLLLVRQLSLARTLRLGEE